MRHKKLLQPLYLSTDTHLLEAKFAIFQEILDEKKVSAQAWLPLPPKSSPTATKLAKLMRVGEEIDPAVSCVVTTSGSTGLAKGVMLTPQALNSSIQATYQVMPGPAEWVLAMPPFHIAGLQVILRSVYAGHLPKVVDITEGFSPEKLLPIIESFHFHKKHYLALLPNQLAKIAKHPDVVKALVAFDAILTGGGGINPQLKVFYKQHNIKIIYGYGMSETCGGCVYDGIPLANTQVQLTPQTKRIQLQGSMLAVGYRNGDSFPLDNNGWFTTNDLGEWQNRRLVVKGRSDSVINMAGVKVIPEEIENKIKQLYFVSDCVVLGLPDEIYGEIIAAAICLTEEQFSSPQFAKISYIKQKLGEILAPLLVPKKILILANLPELPNGKIDRKKLTEMLTNA